MENAHIRHPLKSVIVFDIYLSLCIMLENVDAHGLKRWFSYCSWCCCCLFSYVVIHITVHTRFLSLCSKCLPIFLCWYLSIKTSFSKFQQQKKKKKGTAKLHIFGYFQCLKLHLIGVCMCVWELNWNSMMNKQKECKLKLELQKIKRNFDALAKLSHERAVKNNRIRRENRIC